MKILSKKYPVILVLLLLLTLLSTPISTAASEISAIETEVIITEAEDPAPEAEAPTSLPSSYDPRTTNPVMVTPVKSQMGDTCWAFGAVATLESYIVKHTGTARIYSENYHNYFTATNAFNTGANPNAFNRTLNGTGQVYFSVHNMINWNGPVLDSQFPASVSGQISPDRLNIAPDMHVQGYDYFSNVLNETQRAAKVNDMKRAIHENGAVATSMISSDTGGTYFKYPAIYRPNSVGGSTNHVIAYVGWDDNYATSNFSIAPPGPGAFIMKNSWGTGGSGDAGYYYVSYYDRSIFHAIGLSISDVEPVSNYDKNYSLTKTIAIGSKQILSLTAANLPFYAANVFTRDPAAGEYLDAVGVFIHAADMPYEIYINPGGSTLNSSSLIMAASGTSSSVGYVTIPITRQQLTGTKFAVAVKMRSHTSYPTFASDRKASTGETYLSTTGLNAFVDNGSSGHFYINAYTSLSSAPPLPGVNTVTVSGTPGVGLVMTGAATLTAPVSNPQLTYRWQRSSDQVLWNDIAGAAASTYTPVTADSDHYIRLGVKGTGTNVSVAEKFSAPVAIPGLDQEDPAQDNADIAAAAAAIENAVYTATQAEVSTMAEANAAAASIIGSLALNGVSAVIADLSFTAAIAGIQNDTNGTDGIYTFTVSLSKGIGTPVTTAQRSLSILATPYRDSRFPLAIRAAQVDSTLVYGTWMKTDLQTAFAPCTWKNNSTSAMPRLYSGTMSIEEAGRYYFVLAGVARWSLDGTCKVIAVDVDADGNVEVQGYNMSAAVLGTASNNGKLSCSPNDPATLVVSWGGIPAGNTLVP